MFIQLKKPQQERQVPSTIQSKHDSMTRTRNYRLSACTAPAVLRPESALILRFDRDLSVLLIEYRTEMIRS